MANGNKMSYGTILDNFRDKYVNDNKEHLIAIDKDGFAPVLIHGDSNSVGYRHEVVVGMHIIHNHPNNGSFSRADLRFKDGASETGVTASGRTQDYVFEKTDKFDNTAFQRALTKSPVTDSYSRKPGETPEQALQRVDKATNNWLRANQKRYGYKFRIIKRSNG